MPPSVHRESERRDALCHWLRFAFLLAALLCLGSAVRPTIPRKAAPWPHQNADIQPDPNVIWGRLDNGMRYVLLPNATPKDRVSLRMLVSAGSLMEREDQRGLAHLLEHMAFKGSENMPAGDLVQYLERLGMAFGADTNASTSFDSTVYKLELPSNNSDLLDRSLLVLREKADKLLIPAAELDKERGVVLSEKRLRDTAQYRCVHRRPGFPAAGHARYRSAGPSDWKRSSPLRRASACWISIGATTLLRA